MRRKARDKFIVGIVAAVAVSVMANGVIWNVDKPLREREDITWQYFLFDNNLKKLTTGDFGSLFDTRMFYPRKTTLAFGNSMIGQSLMAIPAYLATRDVVTAANSVVILQLWLAFVAMYILAYSVSKNIGGSLIAGMIYSFNPYVMAHLHHEQLALFGLPALFFVAKDIMRNGMTYKKCFLGAGIWAFLLLSSQYYAFFAALTVPIYFLIRWREKPRMNHWRPLVFAMTAAGLFALGYLRPFVEVKQQYGMKRSLALVELLSANPQDFLFTSPGNWLYGKFSTAPWRDEFAQSHPTEHSLFPGVVALTLAGISIRIRNMRGWWLLLGGSVLLALGPQWGAYRLVYELVPGAQTFRAASRFSVIGFMALAVLAAEGWRHINGKLKVKNGKWARIILLCVLITMAAEYYQTDWVKPFPIPQGVKQFYSWLNKQDDVHVILELPIANDLVHSPNFERSFYDDGQYLLYALWHNKTLVNGHHSFIPEDVSSQGRALTIDFPNAQKLEGLRQAGVDLVIVHREEYRNAKVGERVVERLKSLNVPAVYTQSSITAFRLR